MFIKPSSAVESDGPRRSLISMLYDDITTTATTY